MASIEAGGHHQAEIFIQSRIQLCQHRDRYQHADAVLEYGDTGNIKKHTHDLGSGHSPFLRPVPNGRSSENQHDQNAGVSSKGTGQRENPAYLPRTFRAQ